MNIACAYSMQVHIKGATGETMTRQVVRGGRQKETSSEPMRIRQTGGGSGSNWFRRR